jgi:hypothetical protein
MLYPIINKEAAEKAWQEVAKGAVAHVIADSQDGSLTGAMLCQELFRAHGYLAHLERQHLEIKLELERAKLPIVRREVEVQQAVASALSEEKDGKGNAKKAFSNEDARAAEVERRMGIDTIAVPLAQTVALLTALDQRLLVEMRVQQRRYDAFALLLQSATADVYRDIARTNAIRRLARRMRRPDHRGAARSQDERRPNHRANGDEQRPRAAIPDQHGKCQLVINRGMRPEIKQVLACLAGLPQGGQVQRP